MFELKKEHLILLEKSEFRWLDMEAGSAGIDPKRPYGNSYVESDVAEALGIEYDESMDEELWNLHSETKDAMEIILTLRTFELGMYFKVPNETPRWGANYRWEKHD